MCNTIPLKCRKVVVCRSYAGWWQSAIERAVEIEIQIETNAHMQFSKFKIDAQKASYSASKAVLLGGGTTLVAGWLMKSERSVCSENWLLLAV